MTTGPDEEQLSLRAMLIELEKMDVESSDDYELRCLAAGIGEMARIEYALKVNRASDAAIAYNETVARCLWQLALHTTPPVPTKRAAEMILGQMIPEMGREVADDILAACQLDFAINYDYERTGEVHDDPSIEARLAAAEDFAKLVRTHTEKPPWSP
jgi:hypothetical protein